MSARERALRPGEAREMEMLNDEIANFQEQRRPDRFFPGTTTPKPLHPITSHRWCRLAGTMNNGPGRRIAHVARRSG
jgi:hypothetical protein